MKEYAEYAIIRKNETVSEVKRKNFDTAMDVAVCFEYDITTGREW